MNKTEYMNALQLALAGLPANVIEETLWAYEARFVDGLVAGKKEEEIAAGLPQPGLVAAQKKAGVRYRTFKNHVSPGNLASLLVALLGLLVLNMFMIVPAIMYFSMLCATYVVALSLYVAGIGMTAASLSGVQQFSFDLPAAYNHVLETDDDDIVHERWQRGEPVRIEIDQNGILIDSETGADAVKAANDKGGAVQVEIDNRLAGNVWRGIALLLGSILLLMCSMLLTKYSFIGCKHYLRWNLAQLRVHQHA